MCFNTSIYIFVQSIKYKSKCKNDKYDFILFFDFNALNYQDSHFVISRNVYIRIIFDDIFLSTSKLTLFSIEKGWIITDRRNNWSYLYVILWKGWNC